MQIIPKKSESNLFNSLNVFFYLSLILIIIFVAGSVGLFFLQKNMTQKLQDLKVDIAKKGSVEELALEKQVLLTQKKINDFGDLIALHRAASKFFANLEKLTHPSVFFSSIDLNVTKGSVSLAGTTESFETLGQQILILKDESYVKDISLLGASIGKEGKIEFAFDILFASEEFKY